MSSNAQAIANTGGDTRTGYAAPQLAAIAARLFCEGPLLLRTAQKYRPYICPFEVLIPWVPTSGRLLDVGCGSGLWLGLLAEIGTLKTPAAGIGFDSSKPAIQVAHAMRSRLAHPERLEIQHLDVRAPWPADPFDAVSIIDVLHHVPLPARQNVLALAASALKPGGVLIYKDMTCRTWRASMNRLHDLVMAREWIRYTPIAHVESWARDLGLVQTHASNHIRLWYGHELRVFTKPLHTPGGAS